MTNEAKQRRLAEKESRPVELVWAAVAWTQFLISITVIAKTDMKLIGKFFRMLCNSPATLLSDLHPFGSVALLLNVMSLALFSFPLTLGMHWIKNRILTWIDIGVALGTLR